MINKLLKYIRPRKAYIFRQPQFSFTTADIFLYMAMLLVSSLFCDVVKERIVLFTVNP